MSDSDRRMKSVSVFSTSGGMILIRQKVRGDQDSIIMIVPDSVEVFTRDLRKARAEIKNRKNKNESHSRRNV